MVVLVHSLRRDVQGAGRGRARAANAVSQPISTPPNAAAAAMDHERRTAAVMVCVRLMAAEGMKCGVELKSYGRSMVIEM